MKNTLTSRITGLSATLVLGLVVAGCGANAAASGTGSQAEGAQQGQGGQAGQGGGFGGPGGSGKVAAVSGKTAQVQGASSQVAVTWSSTTRFSQQVKATASALKVGDCVVALPSFQAGGSSTSGSAVAAASVRISTATNGSCTGGFGGGFGGGRPPQGAAPSGAPSGVPSGAPTGGPRGGRGGFGAIGEVTAISGSGFTVKSMRPSSSGSGTTSTVSVTTAGSTTWTRETAAKAADVKVGRCVVSQGRPDSTGAIAASSITISQPVNGTCQTRFGGRRPQGTGTQNS